MNAGEAGAASRFEAALRDIGHQLCRDFEFLECRSERRSAAPRAVPKPRAKPALKPVRARIAAKPKLKSARRWTAPAARRYAPPHPEPLVTAAPQVPMPAEDLRGDLETASIRPTASPSPAFDDVAAATDCHRRLRRLGAVFAPLRGGPEAPFCRIDNPVRLLALKTTPRRIAFPDRPTLDCQFAVKFVQWLDEAGAPVIRARTNSVLVALSTGPGHDCQNRDGGASAMLDEHGFGNAVDIAEARLANGERLRAKDVLSTASPFHAAMNGLYASACGHFTTVLGPGADADHRKALHLDLGDHGKSDNYAVCR
jgi:hypothetical protein